MIRYREEDLAYSLIPEDCTDHAQGQMGEAVWGTVIGERKRKGKQNGKTQLRQKKGIFDERNSVS